MAYTPAQQAALDAAKKAADNALIALNEAKQRVFEWQNQVNVSRSNYYSCKEKRDAKSTGWAKNNACHIDTLNSYSSSWNNAEKNLSLSQSDLAQKQAQYDTAVKQLEETMERIEKEVGADPSFQLAKEKLSKDHLRKMEELKAKEQRKIIIYVFAGVAFLVVVFAALKIFKVI